MSLSVTFRRAARAEFIEAAAWLRCSTAGATPLSGRTGPEDRHDARGIVDDSEFAEHRVERKHRADANDRRSLVEFGGPESAR